MEFVIGVLALFFVLFVTLGVFVTVKAVRAVQRGVERTGTQVRRTVEETTLKAKSMQAGPVGELARTRLQLRASIDSTRRALEAGAVADPSLREAMGLLDRLHEHARQLDGELHLLMEREPERARMAERLPEARERVAHIKEAADSLRFAAQDRARQYDAEGLSALREQIEIESGALRHWQRPDGPAAEEGRELPGSPGRKDAVQSAHSPPHPEGPDQEQAQKRSVPQSQPQQHGPGERGAPGSGPARTSFNKGRPQGAS